LLPGIFLSISRCYIIWKFEYVLGDVVNGGE
jgi:hypothetical protein